MQSAPHLTLCCPKCQPSRSGERSVEDMLVAFRLSKHRVQLACRVTIAHKYLPSFVATLGPGPKIVNFYRFISALRTS